MKLKQETDADIFRLAINTLAWNPLVQHDRIKVTVQDGWISLDGEVDKWYQKLCVESALGHMTEIKGINNDIMIKQKLL
jgi:osmotically-inducible protein OsmY